MGWRSGAAVRAAWGALLALACGCTTSAAFTQADGGSRNQPPAMDLGPPLSPEERALSDLVAAQVAVDEVLCTCLAQATGGRPTVEQYVNDHGAASNVRAGCLREALRGAPVAVRAEALDLLACVSSETAAYARCVDDRDCLDADGWTLCDDALQFGSASCVDVATSAARALLDGCPRPVGS